MTELDFTTPPLRIRADGTNFLKNTSPTLGGEPTLNTWPPRSAPSVDLPLALRADRPTKSAEERRKANAERQRRFRKARRDAPAALRKLARKRIKSNQRPFADQTPGHEQAPSSTRPASNRLTGPGSSQVSELAGSGAQRRCRTHFTTSATELLVAWTGILFATSWCSALS